MLANTKPQPDPPSIANSRFTESTFEEMALRGTNVTFEIKLYESAENVTPAVVKQPGIIMNQEM